jgi:hypothetical protein
MPHGRDHTRRGRYSDHSLPWLRYERLPFPFSTEFARQPFLMTSCLALKVVPNAVVHLRLRTQAIFCNNRRQSNLSGHTAGAIETTQCLHRWITVTLSGRNSSSCCCCSCSNSSSTHDPLKQLAPSQAVGGSCCNRANGIDTHIQRERERERETETKSDRCTSFRCGVPLHMVHPSIRRWSVHETAFELFAVCNERRGRWRWYRCRNGRVHGLANRCPSSAAGLCNSTSSNMIRTTFAAHRAAGMQLVAGGGRSVGRRGGLWSSRGLLNP